MSWSVVSRDRERGCSTRGEGVATGLLSAFGTTGYRDPPHCGRNRGGQGGARHIVPRSRVHRSVSPGRCGRQAGGRGGSSEICRSEFCGEFGGVTNVPFTRPSVGCLGIYAVVRLPVERLASIGSGASCGLESYRRGSDERFSVARQREMFRRNRPQQAVDAVSRGRTGCVRTGSEQGPQWLSFRTCSRVHLHAACGRRGLNARAGGERPGPGGR